MESYRIRRTSLRKISWVSRHVPFRLPFSHKHRCDACGKHSSEASWTGMRQAEVGRHEPRLALDGGPGPGTDAFAAICSQAALALRPGGFLALVRCYSRALIPALLLSPDDFRSVNSDVNEAWRFGFATNRKQTPEVRRRPCRHCSRQRARRIRAAATAARGPAKRRSEA